MEQSVLGGVAHLLNFDGTDTLSAAYYAQFALNSGKPVGMSIPATEHSVMTAWPTEQEAIENMIQKFGTGLFATVMDSYDYQKALDTVVPAVSAQMIESGGYWVLRPDSGDPKDSVLAALRAAEKTFGVTMNSKGYKVTKGVGVIQGDGVSTPVIAEILSCALAEGYSAQNIAFGMGGGLLQKVNRDTLSMAVKLCHITYADGNSVDVMKFPVNDTSKTSLPGEVAVKLVDGIPTVFPASSVDPHDNLLHVVYDRKPIPHDWPDFDSIRQRISAEWDSMPRVAHCVSPEMEDKKKTVRASLIASQMHAE